MSRTYAQHQQDLMPGALRGDYGLAWARAQGTLKDRLVARTRESVYAGGVADPEGRGRECPDDALEKMGRDAMIERSPLDTNASYRARIANAWEVHSWAGTLYGITIAVGLLGQGTPTASPWYALRWDTDSRRWARYVITFTGRATYGASSYGAVTYGGRQVQGIETADPAVARPALRKVLRRWINARDRVERVSIARGGARYAFATYGDHTFATEETTTWGAPIYGDPGSIYGDAAFGTFC